MKDIKIAFFDIDGTLIDIQKKVISEKTIEMLHRLRKNNVKICIATGRAPMTLPRFPEIEFDTYLTFNGSYCYNSKETIFSNPIPGDEVSKIIENAKEIGRPVSIAAKNNLIANGSDQDLIDYYAIAGLKVVVGEEFSYVQKEDVYQMMLGCRKDEYPAIMKDVTGAKITAWWDRAIDVIPANGGKGRGVEEILKYYHLSKEEAIAFGDGNNDIEMMQAVGLSVAMGNGSDELKAISKDVCGSSSEDGIYHYCLEHGLI